MMENKIKFFNQYEQVFLLSLLAFAYEKLENKKDIDENLFLELGTQQDYLRMINNISSKTILFSINFEQNSSLKKLLNESINQDKIKKLLKKG